jgi:hypothetical protein
MKEYRNTSRSCNINQNNAGNGDTSKKEGSECEDETGLNLYNEGWEKENIPICQ